MLRRLCKVPHASGPVSQHRIRDTVAPSQILKLETQIASSALTTYNNSTHICMCLQLHEMILRTPQRTYGAMSADPSKN